METQSTVELIITRTLNAPREIVYQAWTDGDKFGKWWGPVGMELVVATADIRPGGSFHYCMKSAHGEMWGKFIYREFVEPEKIVFVNTFSDKDGGLIKAPFFPIWPLEVLNTLTLTDIGDSKTSMELRGGPINASDDEIAAFAGHVQSMEKGFGGTFEQLEKFLAGVPLNPQ